MEFSLFVDFSESANRIIESNNHTRSQITLTDPGKALECHTLRTKLQDLELSIEHQRQYFQTSSSKSAAVFGVHEVHTGIMANATSTHIPTSNTDVLDDDATVNEHDDVSLAESVESTSSVMLNGDDDEDTSAEFLIV